MADCRKHLKNAAQNEPTDDDCNTAISSDDTINILMKTHIPDCQNALHESNINLEKIADYCFQNYIQNENKAEALNVTSNYTKQALASISNQIYNCASNISSLMDVLENQLDENVSKMNFVQMKWNFHKEKCDRRQIGRLTKPKFISSQPAIIYPSVPKSKMDIRYFSEPIDFSIFDDIGIGSSLFSKENTLKSIPTQVRSATLRSSKSTNLASIIPTQDNESSAPTISASQRLPAPNVRPPTPPFGTLKFSSLNRGNKDYRAIHSQLPVIAPPKLPSNYNANNVVSTEEKFPKSSNSLNSISTQAVSQIAPITSSTSNTNLNIQNDKAHVTQPNSTVPATENVAQFSNLIPANYLEKVVATYDYSASNDDELSFQENSVIYVIRKNDDGWWEGVLNGITGLFPGNYVEPCV